MTDQPPIICKHCKLHLTPSGNNGHVHAQGFQTGLTRCAADPYGFNAEPEDTDCGRTCNGSRGIDVDKIYKPSSVVEEVVTEYHQELSDTTLNGEGTDPDA